MEIKCCFIVYNLKIKIIFGGLIFKISDQYINFKASYDHFKISEKYTILKYT